MRDSEGRFWLARGLLSEYLSASKVAADWQRDHLEIA